MKASEYPGAIYRLHHTSGTRPDFKVFVADWEHPIFFNSLLAVVRPRFVVTHKPEPCTRFEASARVDVELYWRKKTKAEIDLQRRETLI